MAKESVASANKCAALENALTIVSMTVLPLAGEWPVLKSRALWDQGQLGMGNGQRKSQLS